MDSGWEGVREEERRKKEESREGRREEGRDRGREEKWVEGREGGKEDEQRELDKGRDKGIRIQRRTTIKEGRKPSTVTVIMVTHCEKSSVTSNKF